MQATYLCYAHYPFKDRHMDTEQIWSYVQRVGGWLNILVDRIEYYVPQSAELLLLIAWPQLQRLPDRDYV